MGVDDAPVWQLRNLGPFMARRLAEIGVATVGELRALGAAEAWRRMRFAGPDEMTLTGLYAMEAGLRS